MGNTNKNGAVRTVKGTRALANDDFALSKGIENIVRETAKCFGYGEMQTPEICQWNTLACKFAEGSELAEEIYALSDRGGRFLALRYDLTVPFARYVADNLGAMTFPAKRYECGKVFRDGPVKSGRMREFTQCDIDCITDSFDAYIPLEQICCAFQVFDTMGMFDVKMKYSSRMLVEGVLRSLGVDKEKVGEIIRVMDKKDKMSQDAFRDALAEARVESDMAQELTKWCEVSLDDLRSIYTAFDGEEDAMLRGGIEEVLGFADMLDRIADTRGRCELDVSLVRGQEYYTGIVFEFYAEDFPSSIAAGGFYDALVSGIIEADGIVNKKAQELVGCGLSFGVVPIAEVIRKRTEETAREREGMIVISCGSSTKDSQIRLENDLAAINFACILRRSGIACDVDVADRSVSKKMKFANRKGCRFAIVYGENEMNAPDQKVCVKDMETGNEYVLTRDALCLGALDTLST